MEPCQEDGMVTISAEALDEMKKVLADKGDDAAVRIYIAGYG